MKYRQLGNSNLNVSTITFGAWAIGGWMWGGTERKEAVEAILASYDSGARPDQIGSARAPSFRFDAFSAREAYSPGGKLLVNLSWSEFARGESALEQYRNRWNCLAIPSR